MSTNRSSKGGRLLATADRDGNEEEKPEQNAFQVLMAALPKASTSGQKKKGTKPKKNVTADVSKGDVRKQATFKWRPSLVATERKKSVTKHSDLVHPDTNDDETTTMMKSPAEILKDFDFDCMYGACLNITRKERLQRALRYNLSGKTKLGIVGQLLQNVDDDSIHNISVLDRHAILH